MSRQRGNLSTLKRAVGFLILVGMLAGAVAPLIVSLAPENPTPTSESSDEALALAFDEQRSDFWIEGTAVVTRLLADDDDGSRHQRLVVRLATGQTLLIAHNIDVAPRLGNVSVGDRLAFRGEYVWNAQGGLIHWTHADPDNRRPGGWLEWRGRRYR